MPDIHNQNIEIPPFLRDFLTAQYGAELTEDIVTGYREIRPVTIRVNRLKATREEVARELSACGISFRVAEWYSDALVLEGVREEALQSTPLYQEGKIYLQSLSSMLPPLYLGPEKGDEILDMTAAPGGKTTQLSALSDGGAFITACERDKIRFDRLSYNVRKQGAPRVNTLLADALKLDDFLRFDKILLDAPCSGSGTLGPREPIKISEKLIKNCALLQEKLLKKAVGLLKKGGTLVYSTCSILREENERVLERVLSGGVELVPIAPDPDLPLLPSMAGTVCVKPTSLFEGFFLAKLKKL